MSTWTIGVSAEDKACVFLKNLGYQILDRNFRIRGGEIDIVAKDKNDLVFVEVKARWSHNFGSPIEAITNWKLKALYKTALFYITKISWGDKPYRFDVVTLDYADDKNNPKIEVINNVSQ